MINKIIFIIAAIVYYVYTYWKLKNDVHMLQLNSNFNVRYIRWINRNIKRVLKVRELIPLLSVIFIFFNKLTLAYISFGVIYLILFLTRNTEKQKKKLVFTARVKRLVVTVTILLLAAFLPLALNQGMYKASAVSVLAVIILVIINILTPGLILLGNAINLPMENSIKRYYYNDAKRIMKEMKNLKVVGITGSYGKTSTKHVVNKILSKSFNVLMTPEGINTTMGVTRVIRTLLKPTHEIFIAEMGAKNVGDIKEICDLVGPHYGILTSVGPMHLETFKTIENVKKTKYELMEALPEDGIGIQNMDDANIKSIPKTAKCRCVYYGIDSEIHYWAEDIKFTSKGSVFTVCKHDGSREVFQTKLLGKHNIYNILSGIAIASELGMDLKTISYAVRDLEPVEHRLEIKKKSGGITIIDDAYNSNPVGSKMALEVLSQMEGKKIMITPGMIELGEKEYELNKAFGEYAAAACDYIILVGKKQTVPISDGLKAANYPEDRYFVARNLNEAFQHLQTVAKGDSIVLLENDLTDDYNE